MGRAYSASTSAIHPSERIEFWNAGSDRIGGVRAETMSDVFDAEVSFRKLDELSLYRLASTPHRVTMNVLEPAGGKRLRLRYQQSGRSLVFQGQRGIEINSGQWMVVDPHLSHAAVNHGDVSHLWLEVPFSSLSEAELVTALSGDAILPMDRSLAGDLLECMHHTVDAPGEFAPEVAKQLAGEMTGMFRKALRQLPGLPAPLSAREETARRAREFVDRNLCDPDLSVMQIARELGCTPRYIHKAFEGSETVSRYIWNRRLDMCRNQLEKHPLKSQTLTDVAFDYGFNSSSHFSRSFRERFGTTPSLFLATVQRGQG